MDNFNYCKSIREDLKKYASGNYCLIDEELIEIDQDNENEDNEPVTLWDYISNTDFFNINYILDSNKELVGVRLMVACGGPNVYINTWERRVELFWWSEKAFCELSPEICEEINDIMGEYFNC